MKKIGDGIYEHNGVKCVAVQGGCLKGVCSRCALRSSIWPCTMGQKCEKLIGENQYFKLYEEPKVKKIKLADVSFKCAVLTPERSEILQKAVFAVGGKWSCFGQKLTYLDKPFLTVDNYGELVTTESVNIFVSRTNPELTLQQALDLLATVEKLEPVFDIKLRDEVLCRDAAEAWEIKNFARTMGDCSNFATFGARYLKMIRFAGNEQYHGTKDTPSGWWEAKDGKPVWVTE